MAEMYGARIIEHCINCCHSIADPECGYTCRDKSFPIVCENYYPDKEFIMNDIKWFFKYWESKKND